MHQSIRTLGCFVLVGLGSLFAQGPTLTGVGYSDPSIIRVTPGQIITLFVTGLRTVLPSEPIQAQSVPLPTSLAGISVTLNQSEQPALPVPLLSLQQLSVCGEDGGSAPSAATPDCLITAISVQIPFEILPLPEGRETALTVRENGADSAAFRVFPVPSNLHILNGCDAFPQRRNTCGGVVTHGDGALVTEESPAKAGETVVVYAFGLGRTTPAVATGVATPTPAPGLLETVVIVDFDFRIDAAPSHPFGRDSTVPTFVGLTPGQVGLYQINVRIPDIVPPVAPCSIRLGIVSNLTINVGSSTFGPPSFDGAPICVQPPQ